MSEVLRVYPVLEVALAAVSRQAFGNERVLAGDVVAVRRPSPGIGRREASEFLWLRLEGLEADELGGLAVALEQAGEVVFDKRRYAIPLHRLAAVDVARIEDPADAYQPFLPIDDDTGLFLEGADRAPLQVSGLVFDKTTGSYL